MMMKIKTTFVSLSILFFSSYIAADDIQAATDDVCNCLKSPYSVVEKAFGDLQKAQASGDYSKMMALQGEMMAIVDSTAECFEALPAKYPDISKSEALQAQVMSQADKQCPNPAEGMFQ